MTRTARDRVTWFLKGQILGVSLYQQKQTNDFLLMPMSTAYFCHGCGEVWGRLYVEGHFKRAWVAENRHCESCDGGFLFPVRWPWLWDTAPKDVLARELTLIPVNPANPNLSSWTRYPNCRSSFWKDTLPLAQF